MNDYSGIQALDILAAVLAYLSLHQYDESEAQSKKLDSIIYNMEKKLDFQNEMLEKI
jgi:hypothetical protein